MEAMLSIALTGVRVNLSFQKLEKVTETGKVADHNQDAIQRH